jgi:hypothetical protein
MRSAAIISIAVAMLVLSPHVISQNTSLTDFDPIAAGKNIRESSRRFSKSLHEFERYPDGARGFGAPNPIPLRASRGRIHLRHHSPLTLSGKPITPTADQMT